ncbi:MAG TPA: hypothetical protein VFP43_04165 [Mesorhizobium sp.]|nr:hypothetical protein [Mesorhizobium sp.]
MAGKPATHNKHRHAAAAVVKQQPAGEAVETSTLDCLSVDEFCRRNSLSTQYFYKAPEEMPPSFRLGARRLITREAAERWRLARDAEAATHGKQRERV